MPWSPALVLVCCHLEHTCCGGAFGMIRITDSRSPFSLRYDGAQSFGTVPQQGVRACGEFSPQSAAMHTPAAFFFATQARNHTRQTLKSCLCCYVVSWYASVDFVQRMKPEAALISDPPCPCCFCCEASCVRSSSKPTLLLFLLWFGGVVWSLAPVYLIATTCSTQTLFAATSRLSGIPLRSFLTCALNSIDLDPLHTQSALLSACSSITSHPYRRNPARCCIASGAVCTLYSSLSVPYSFCGAVFSPPFAL